MARPKKYEFGTKNISISLPVDILHILDKKAIQAGKKRSEFITFILETAIKDRVEYASMKAKEHNRQFYYWKSEKERLESERDE